MQIRQRYLFIQNSYGTGKLEYKDLMMQEEIKYDGMEKMKNQIIC